MEQSLSKGFSVRAALLALAAGLAALAFTLVAPQPAHAYGYIDLDTKPMATVVYTDDTSSPASPIEGADFRLYRVASLDERANISSVESAFSSYASAINDANEGNSSWDTLAKTLSAFVTDQSAAGNAISPEVSLSTNSNGQASFTASSAGIYLMVGDALTVTQEDGTKITYTPTPTMTSLPVLENEDWDYEATLIPKKERTETPVADTTDISVVIVWDDEGFEDERPDEVTVKLYKDGELYDTRTISKDDDWRYTWTGLDAGSDWQLVEDPVPSNYTYTVELKDGVFVVTNVRKASAAPTDNGGTSNTGTSTGTTSNTGTTTKASATTGTSGTQTTTPKTGQPWSPVLLVGLAGIVLVAVAVPLRRRRNQRDES